MNTLSIHKEEKASMVQVARKWWNSKNALFSAFTGEVFTNREVVLAHLILIAFLACTAFIETYPAISVLAIIVSAICVRLLNCGAKKNDNVSN